MATNDNVLIEMRKLARKHQKKNNKKKRLITLIDLVLVGILVLCIIIFWDKITPAVEQYVRWLSSPVVCIDPGHGGNQTGAIVEEYDRVEKDDNLALSLAVRDILKEYGIRTIMTRTKDETVSLNERCKYANRKNAKLFVSIHRNQANNLEAKGIEIWAGKNMTKEETLLATNILNRILKCPYTINREVRYGSQTDNQSDYYVNLKTEMPSVICEMGFVTNEEDNIYFDENFMSYAKAIADGIVDTLKELYPDEMINEDN